MNSPFPTDRDMFFTTWTGPKDFERLETPQKARRPELSIVVGVRLHLVFEHCRFPDEITPLPVGSYPARVSVLLFASHPVSNGPGPKSESEDRQRLQPQGVSSRSI